MRWQRLQTYLASFLVLPISFLLVGHFSGLNPFATTWDVLALFLAAAAWLYFGGRVFVGRKRQEERERHFTSSLRDEIDRDIAQVTYQIDGRRDHVELRPAACRFTQLPLVGDVPFLVVP